MDWKTMCDVARKGGVIELPQGRFVQKPRWKVSLHYIAREIQVVGH